MLISEISLFIHSLNVFIYDTFITCKFWLGRKNPGIIIEDNYRRHSMPSEKEIFVLFCFSELIILRKMWTIDSNSKNVD